MVVAFLGLSTLLMLFWLLFLITVSREDWETACQSKIADNLMKIDKLRRKDATNEKKLSQYHGISHVFMKLLIGGNSENEIMKIALETKSLNEGIPKGVGILEMPGYTMQRVLSFIGDGVLQKNILTKCLELYGKKYALDKTTQVLARICSYSLIGIAFTLSLGSLIYYLADKKTGLIVTGVGSMIIMGLVYAIYDDVGDNLNKRRTAIARQFPNVVSKMALLVTSGMILDRAWRETAESQELELYQEMRRTSDELDRLVDPEVAYTNFIDRCNTKETTKLASALIQSLSKGNTEIGILLKGLAHDAWEERQHTARRDAEAANSKLMIPTMLLFLAIMIMIMVPIAMTFTTL